MNGITHDQMLALWAKVDGLQAKGYTVDTIEVGAGNGALYVYIHVLYTPDAQPLESTDNRFGISSNANVFSLGG